MKVKSVRYFKTNRGTGYEAKTDKGSIFNDGQGGCTYFRADSTKCNPSDYHKLSEWDLEAVIDRFEGVKR